MIYLIISIVVVFIVRSVLCLIYCMKLAKQKGLNKSVAGTLGFFFGLWAWLYYRFCKSSKQISPKLFDETGKEYPLFEGEEKE